MMKNLRHHSKMFIPVANYEKIRLWSYKEITKLTIRDILIIIALAPIVFGLGRIVVKIFI